MADFPTFIGAYRIKSVIGCGSSGRVLKAFDQKFSRWVAIKLLYPYQESTIVHEAKLLAGIKHPNVVDIYELIEDERLQQSALVMECLSQHTFKFVLDAADHISVKIALKYCLEIAMGLSAIHRQGIIHGDLKPENIFLDLQKHIKIGDFGTAIVIDQRDDSPMIGSYYSISPERALGKALTPQSDLFALGLLLYQLLAGQHPFEQHDGTECMLKRLIDEPFPPLAGCRGMVNDLLRSLLAKDPSHRYKSAQDVVENITAILTEK